MKTLAEQIKIATKLAQSSIADISKQIGQLPDSKEKSELLGLIAELNNSGMNPDKISKVQAKAQAMMDSVNKGGAK